MNEYNEFFRCVFCGCVNEFFGVCVFCVNVFLDVFNVYKWCVCV